MNKDNFFLFLEHCMEQAKEGEQRAIRDDKPDQVIKYKGIQKMILYINGKIESGVFDE